MKAKFVVLGILIGLVFGFALFGVPATAQSSSPTCVGVGVTNPTEKLEVDGNVKATGAIIEGEIEAEDAVFSGDVEANVIKASGTNANVLLNGVPVYVGCNWDGRQGYNDDGAGGDFAVVCKEGRIIMWCHMNDRTFREGKYDCS